ncbi:MAG TPA: ABC transporter permease [Phycisphaerae bacterium]|nr:ABC transporter permease [Phycisphaerae bacterium]
MIPLPLANILHHKVRSGLSALGVAIAVAMLVTLAGLSRGSLQEVADRWEVVDADLIVRPAQVGENLVTARQGLMGPREVERVTELADGGVRVFDSVVPVYVHRWRIAGQEHNVVGVAPGHLGRLLSGGKLQAGRVFDPRNAFADWLEGRLSAPADDDEVIDITPEELGERGGLEMVVDSRLARAAALAVGSKVRTAGHTFTVVGIAREGAMVRAFVPLATAQWLGGDPHRVTFLFASLGRGVDEPAAIRAVEGTRRLSAVPLGRFRAILMDQFGIMFVYVDAANTITLIVAFLFVLVTLYTAVIQRTREIAILRSMGATRRFVLAQVTCESLILTACGAAGGIALSFPAAALIEAARPFLTVAISAGWIVTGVCVAVIGGVAASVYPAWCAIRVDVCEAINLE